MINYADPNMRNTIAQALMSQQGRPPQNLAATPTPGGQPGGPPPPMPGPAGGIPPALGSGPTPPTNLGGGGGMSPAVGANAPPPSTMLGQPSMPSTPPPPALTGTPPPPPIGPSQNAGGAFGINTSRQQPGYGGGSPAPMAAGGGSGNMAGLDPNILAQLTGVRT